MIVKVGAEVWGCVARWLELTGLTATLWRLSGSLALPWAELLPLQPKLACRGS
ncbi:hypothetical protein [Infirmifilum sp. SLHALR2]